MEELRGLIIGCTILALAAGLAITLSYFKGRGPP